MTKWSCDAEQRVGKLEIEQGLTVAQVCRLKEVLLHGFDEAGQVSLDVSTVADVDIAGLQLLCATHRLAVARGKELLLTGVGERVLDLVHSAGFVRGSQCGIGRDVPCFWTAMAR